MALSSAVTLLPIGALQSIGVAVGFFTAGGKVHLGQPREVRGHPVSLSLPSSLSTTSRVLAGTGQAMYHRLIVENVKAMSSFSLEVESKESQSTNSL